MHWHNGVTENTRYASVTIISKYTLNANGSYYQYWIISVATELFMAL